MASLLIKNIESLVTCDSGERILSGADIYCEDGFIKRIGRNLSCEADEVIDGSHLICYPGLVNTHHHFFQTFVRSISQIDYPSMTVPEWIDKI